MDPEVAKKLDDFFGKHETKKYKKGEILINPEQTPSGVFYLKEGVVKQYAISQNGDELILNIFRPVSFFPMSWVLNDSPSSYYFEAMSPVLVRRAPKGEVLNFLKSENDVLLDLIKRVYRGLDGFLSRMEHLMGDSAKHRLLNELIILAKRFGETSKNQIVINLKLTEKDLGAASGTTRETVSRELQKLEEKGLVKFKKNTVTVADLHKLEEELLLK